MSGEIWQAANSVRAWNFGREEPTVDVRELDPSNVPDCEVIVGSPPCTQFSFANRGGNGDIADGMKDVRAFLRIVREKNPRWWIMENVPRLAGILRSELAPGGSLADFADLFCYIDDFDLSEWGVPQRRRRCIAGRYPRDALIAMKGRRAPTLGEVLEACRIGFDPVWGERVGSVTDNEPGASLSWEEERTNREKKSNHPIYNDMAFPDPLDRPARTMTATCTKVSRESVVVADGRGGHRLLSVRETAAIQSFPLSYQFAGASRSDRIKMAGNAVPPLFTYFVGLAVSGLRPPEKLPFFDPARGIAASASPETGSSRSSRKGRGFRAAIASLRFKSGMSFEINNTDGAWKIVFNSGGPGKAVVVGPRSLSTAASVLGQAEAYRFGFSDTDIQDAWDHSRDCSSHPYRIADAISSSVVPYKDSEAAERAVRLLYSSTGKEASAKAIANARMIAAGILLAEEFNSRSTATLQAA